MKSEKLQFPIAVLSDVCANLEALEAVLADIKNQGAKSILFLGDAISYGPNPAECLDLLRDSVNVYLLGRAEVFMLEQVFNDLPTPPDRKNPYDWALECFESVPEPRKGRPKRLPWLSSRPDGIIFEKMVFTHSFAEIRGFFLFKEPDFKQYDHLIRKKLGASDVLIMGGDHYPAYANLDQHQATHASESLTLKIKPLIPLMIGVGSVGQPRDKNTKASYVIVNEAEIYWRRVAYDFEKTVAKIKANPKISVTNAARLLVGR